MGIQKPFCKANEAIQEETTSTQTVQGQELQQLQASTATFRVPEEELLELYNLFTSYHSVLGVKKN